jgi:poly(A) polymerase
MLRAVRFKAKLGFSIEEQTEAGIFDCADLLSNINTARLFDESLKLFLSGYSQAVFFDLEKYQLLPFLLSDSKRLLDSEFNKKLFTLALANTDKRIQQEKSINPAFLWAVFLWPLVIELKQELEHDQLPPMAALYEAANSVLSKQQRLVAISKRFQAVIKEIWELQLRLENTQGKRSERAYEHPRFRAGYDFLLLREQAGENCNNLGNFWTEMQQKQPRKEPQRKPYERPRKRRPQNKK